MQFSIDLDKDLRIIKYKAWGRIDKNDIGVGWQEIIGRKEFTDLGYHVLADYRYAQFSFSIDDTTILDRIIEASKIEFKGKKNAVIVTLPHSTAISMIVKGKFHPKLGYEIEIFYTEEAAIKWLLE